MNTAIKSILLVDDDLDDQIFFQEALKVVDRSVHLTTARNGIEAISQLRMIIPDVILLDLNMPRMNGVECLQELRKSAELSLIPVMIYSSFVSSFDRAEVNSLGVNEFVRKPISFTDTVETIRKMLAGSDMILPGQMLSNTTQGINMNLEGGI